jgi:hypothetical protein
MQRFDFTSLGLALLSALILSTPARAQSYTCPTANSATDSLRARVARYQTSPDWAKLRTNFSITDTDSTHVSVVTADSICTAITQTVNASGTSTRSSSVLIVQLGNLFVACDNVTGPLSAVYLLDDHYTLLTVVIPAG